MGDEPDKLFEQWDDNSMVQCEWNVSKDVYITEGLLLSILILKMLDESLNYSIPYSRIALIICFFDV